MVLRDLARSMVAEEAAAARLSNRRRGPPEAATKTREAMMMKKTTNPVSTSFRKPQRPCVLTGVPRCILLIADLNSGCVRLMQRSRRLMHGNL
jgi:hypothetical protein